MAKGEVWLLRSIGLPEKMRKVVASARQSPNRSGCEREKQCVSGCKNELVDEWRRRCEDNNDVPKACEESGITKEPVSNSTKDGGFGGSVVEGSVESKEPERMLGSGEQLSSSARWKKLWYCAEAQIPKR